MQKDQFWGDQVWPDEASEAVKRAVLARDPDLFAAARALVRPHLGNGFQIGPLLMPPPNAFR